MSIPLVVLAVLSIVGGAASTCRSTNAKLDFLDAWLEPVFVGARPVHASSFSDGVRALDGRARSSVCRHHRRRARLPQRPAAPTAPTRRSSARRVRQGARERATTSTSRLARFVQRPGHVVRARSSATASTARASTARSTASATCSAEAAAACARCRPVWCATTRSAIVLGAVLLLAVRRDAGDVLMRRRRSPPIVVDVVGARLPAAHRCSILVPVARRGRRRCSCRAAGPSSRAPSATSRARRPSGSRCTC